jgi:ABC-type multidrug transport system ATPase subunit
LLDLLSNRKTTGSMKGTILFDGSPRTDDISRRSAYVMQDNVHLPMLTIRQTLKYASLLRMRQSLSSEKKQARVSQLITMLGLTEHADTIVGDARVRGISGGQAKRLSIGVEIINLPDIIFLDEPTSGLDSSISLEVFAAIRMLASQNRTIIATIHQPSTALYSMFDKLLLMADGHVIFYGDANSAVDYFISSPAAFQYTRGSNPAEFVIAVAGSLHSASSAFQQSSEESSSDYTVEAMVRYYQKTKFYESLLSHVDCRPIAGEFLPVVTTYTAAFNTSTFFQILVLSERDMRNRIKDPYATITDLMMHLMVSLFYGSIYYQLDNTQYQERLCVLFFSLIFMIMGHQKQMPVIFRERLLFYRERSAGAYGAIAYWIASIFVTLPFIVVNVFIYAITVQKLVGLRNEAGNFFDFLLTLFLISITGMFACRAVAALAPSEQAAINLFPALIQFLMAFSGFGIFLPVMQTWLAVWAPYVTFVRWLLSMCNSFYVLVVMSNLY